MSDPAPFRLGESLKGLTESGLAVVQTRLELFAVELKEEKLRIGGFLLDTVLAALFIGFGIVFLMALFTLLLWDSHPLLALGIATVVLLSGGLFCASRASARLRAGSRLFAASLAEIAQDREALRHKERR